MVGQADISNEDVPAIFDFTQEMIDRTLQNGSGFAEGKFRIYQQMISSLSTEENIKFLKKEYGIGGASLAYSDAEISQWHDAKGIRLYKGYDDRLHLLCVDGLLLQCKHKSIVHLLWFFYGLSMTEVQYRIRYPLSRID